MESPTGRLHEEFKNLLREISKKKSEESINIHQSVLYNYYLKRFSFVFQKSLSSNFLTRTAQINGKMSALSKTNHIYQYSFISDFHKFDSTRIVELWSNLLTLYIVTIIFNLNIISTIYPHTSKTIYVGLVEDLTHGFLQRYYIVLPTNNNCL